MWPLAQGIVLMALGWSAQAVEINTGHEDLKVRFDNTVRYNVGVRAGGQDQALLKNPNFDDGDRNFKNGSIVTNRVDLLSEFDLSYRKDMGFRVSAASWYDDAYKGISGDNQSVATSNNLINGVKTLGYNAYVDRYYKGLSGEVLDAFVYARGDLDGSPASIKVGRSVEYWGEALLSNTHSVSYAQMPLDQAKAIAVPGIDLKEVFRPINNISVRFSPTDSITVSGQYFLDWEATRLPEPGTYLGPADTISNSGQVLLLGPFKVLRQSDITPASGGEYGASLRWNSQALDSTLGFYYRRFADKSGQLHLSNFTGATPGSYFYAFADKIDLYGISLSKQVGVASIGAELSYRLNMPLASDTAAVLTAAKMPGQGDTGGARGNTWHAVTNIVAVISKTALWDTLTTTGELYWNRWDSVTQNENLFKGRDTYVASGAIDAVSKDYLGYALGLTPTWLQVMPGVDLSVPFSVSNGIQGNSAVAAGGSKGAGSWSLGLSADINQRHTLALRYSDYFGDYTTGPTGAMATFNGLTAVLKDRAMWTLTFKSTF